MLTSRTVENRKGCLCPDGTLTKQVEMSGDESLHNCCCAISQQQFDISNGRAAIEIAECVLTVPTALIAILGNLLVLISIYRTPLLHTPPNVLLVSLALSDLGVGLVTSPLFLGSTVARLKQDIGLYCQTIRAYHATSYSLCGVSLVTITAISVERLAALRLHLRYKELVTVRRVAIACGFVWSLGLMFGLLAVWNEAIVGYVSFVVIPSCYVFTAVAFCEITRVIRRHQNQIVSQLTCTQVPELHQNLPNVIQFKRSSLGMLLIYLMFLLCYTPFVVLKAFSYSVDLSGISHSFDGLAVSVIHINSVANPLVYCWRFRNIRAAVKATLAGICG